LRAAQGDVPLPPPSPVELPDVNHRDDDNCTPLHIALLHGNLDAARALLDHGANPGSRCEGSPALHVAISAGAHPARAAFAAAAVRLLVSKGVVPLERDDNGRTALHWAAALGLRAAAEALLLEGAAFAERQRAQLAAVGTGDADGDIPPIHEFLDKHGNSALHLAARYQRPELVEVLLNASGGEPVAQRVMAKNKSGMNALHMAALGGNALCVSLLVRAAPEAVAAINKQGMTPAAMVVKRHGDGAQALHDALAGRPITAASSAGKTRFAPAMTPSNAAALVLAPPECMAHHTAPAPLRRGGSEPPPENINRLAVLTSPSLGILRSVEFAPGLLRWDEDSKRAALGDILRVHDWPYVRRVISACEAVPDLPSEIRHLDGDTAISRGTWAAALAAAGAACTAVDEVVAGRARHAFCAVRPPGHHAGPSGVVTSGRDPHGSHGFCLLNNIAIAAAYAMTVYRGQGINRVAILDFDVRIAGRCFCFSSFVPSLIVFFLYMKLMGGVLERKKERKQYRKVIV
jgi:ankyrin repeat protein